MTQQTIQNSSSQNSGNAPVHTVRLGTVSVSVWQNESKEGNTFFTCKLQRSYTVNENGVDVWKYTDSLGVNDLLAASTALVEAFKWIKTKDKA